jgi:uncharacterized membrane protein YhaH (DUF805 family)
MKQFLLATLALCFSGRINRARYWLGILGVQIFFALALSIPYGPLRIRVDAGTIAGFAFGCFVLIGVIALYAIIIKRLHDINRSGWWLLALIPLAVITGLVVLTLGCIRGTPGSNRFGRTRWRGPLGDARLWASRPAGVRALP